MINLELALQELINNPRKDDPFWYLEVSDIYKQLELFEKAATLLEEAINRGIDDDIIKLNYALFLINLYKYSEAILFLENLEKDYEDQTAIRNLIYCYSRDGRIEEAIAEALELERNVGLDEWLAQELVYAYLRNLQFDDGEKYLHKILELNENNIWAIRQLGNIYIQNCNVNDELFTKAIEYYNKAFQLEPNSNLSLYDIGNIYVKTQEYEEAIEYFLKALEVTATDDFFKEEIIENIALAYYKLYQYEEAYNYFSKLYNEYEVNIETPRAFIRTLMVLNKYDEALEFCFILSDLDKYEKSFIDLLLSEVYIGMRDNEKALQLALEMYEYSPNDEETLENVIEVLTNLEEYEKGLSILKDYLKRNKETIITDNLYQDLYYSLDDYEEAIVYLLKVKEFDENNELINYRLSYAYLFLNDIENTKKYALLLNDIENKITLLESFDLYKDIINSILEVEDYQSDSYLLEELGRAYNNIEDYDNALNALDKIYEYNKEEPQFLYVYAYALDGKGDYEKALETISHSVDFSYDDDDLDRMYLLKGKILRKLNKYDDALEYLNKITDSDFENEEKYYELALIYQEIDKNDLALINYEIIENKFKFSKEIAESYAKLLSALNKEDEAKKYRDLALTLK